jgi:hypothetical protein
MQQQILLRGTTDLMLSSMSENRAANDSFWTIGQRLCIQSGIVLLLCFLLLPGIQHLRHETNQSRSAMLVSVPEAQADLGTISG